MQSTYLSRRLFGCTRISLISAAVLVGTMLLPVKGAAQQTGNSQQPGSTPESPGMAEHAGMPTSLRELIQEAEQKNPQIAASLHAWQATRNVPKQASALPETQSPLVPADLAAIRREAYHGCLTRSQSRTQTPPTTSRRANVAIIVAVLTSLSFSRSSGSR